MPRSSPSYSPAPSLRVVPRKSRDWTLGDLAVKLAAGYGLVADDWQADPVECMLARTKAGRYAAATVKITASRQNGKNGILEIRELFGMVVLGEKFLHTAHEVKTARKAFRRIASFFENQRQFPELAAMVLEIRKTNGQEAILLSNGGSIEFIARSSGSGRGFTVDVLVCDEDQDLTDEELAALLPTISAAPLGNPQVILTGTPPDPEKLDATKGEVARRVRRDAQRKTDPNLLCFDWGVPDGPMPDVDDLAIWHQTNPALGGRLNLAEVQRERKLMSAEKFARERLGWWGNPKVNRRGVIDMSQWRELKVTAQPPTRAAIVVDVSPDLGWTTIGLGTQYLGNRALVLIDHMDGTDAAVRKIVGLTEDLADVVEVALTPTAQIFRARLTRAGVDHELLTNTDLGKACAGFQESIRTGRVAHVGQQVLDDNVRQATTRFVGDAQHWDRRDHKLDTTPIVAASTAAYRWNLLTAKPKRIAPPPRRVPAPTASRGSIATAGF